MRNKTIGTLLLMLTASAAHAYTSSDYLWKAYDGHLYAITLDWSNWAQAEAWAVEVGGHLATVNDAAENTWLTNNFGGYYSHEHPGETWASMVWIGFQRVGSEWSWVSGEPVTFPPPWWSPILDNSPHAYLHPSTHAVPGTWYNSNGEDTIPEWYPRGIIEVSQVIPAPGALVLGAIGVGVVSRLRRRRVI